MNKSLREQLEEILEECFWDARSNKVEFISEYKFRNMVKLLSLFQEEMKKIPCCGHACCCNLKRMEGVGK